MKWRLAAGAGRARLTVGIVLLMTLGAVEELVAAAIMPAVVRDIGGVALYGWVFSGYALASLAGIAAVGGVVDRYGPWPPFAGGMAVYTVGTAACGLAPSMPVLAAARVVQGLGSGVLFALPQILVAKAYPEEARPRILALVSGAYILPGMAGPALGAFIATVATWRVAFFALLPLIPVVAVLTAPWLRVTTGDAAGARRGLTPEARRLPRARIDIRWPVQLAAGAGLALWALSSVSWAAAPAGILGSGLAAHALTHILPAGTWRGRPGLPAAVAVMFLVSTALFGADAFVPLMLTHVRHLSVLVAGLVITAGTLGWGVSSWWQSRIARRARRTPLVIGGTVATGAGIALQAAVLAGAPVALSYLAWVIAGLGMGFAYNTINLAVMDHAAPGAEGTAVSSMQLGEMLGLSVGAGLGGASIAIGRAAGAPLPAGIAGAFLLAFVAAAAATALAPRLGASATRPQWGS